MTFVNDSSRFMQTCPKYILTLQIMFVIVLSCFQETKQKLESMPDADLKCLLDEVMSYKHVGDMQGKSPFVQVQLIIKW